MSYHSLSECSLNNEERCEEAYRIVNMISHLSDSMTKAEQDFLALMGHANYVSVKQLFWLRDIKDKYL